MQWMLDFLAKRYLSPTVSIAIGDAENDLSMLELADFSIVIPNKKNTPLKLKKQEGVIYATELASSGWHQGVIQVLNELGI